MYDRRRHCMGKYPVNALCHAKRCVTQNKIGVYMGIFNFFIVLPEIIASLGFGWIMKNVLHNDRLAAVQIGGGLMIIAALICYFFIKEKD